MQVLSKTTLPSVSSANKPRSWTLRKQKLSCLALIKKSRSTRSRVTEDQTCYRTTSRQIAWMFWLAQSTVKTSDGRLTTVSCSLTTLIIQVWTNADPLKKTICCSLMSQRASLEIAKTKRLLTLLLKHNHGPKSTGRTPKLSQMISFLSNLT